MIRNLTASILLSLLATTALAAEKDSAKAKPASEQSNYTYRFFPVDKIRAHEDAAAFREELSEIVEEKDAPAMLDLISPDVKLSFGDPVQLSEQEIARALQLDDDKKADDSPFWDEMAKMLKMGGYVEKDGSITIPYLFAYQIPPTDWTLHEKTYDATSHPFEFFVTTKATPLFKDKKMDTILRQLRPYETVMLVMDADDGCEAYRTHDGLSGCVNPEHVRSPIDYRAIFTPTEEGYRMTLMVAGD